MRSKNIASASAERNVVVKSLDKYMSASPDSTFQAIPHSSWKESFDSCFGMTNFALDKNGKETPMKPNYRMVPETVKWMAYEPDSKQDIMHRKKVIQERDNFITVSQMHDKHEMRNFTDALLTCLPLTTALNLGEEFHIVLYLSK
jgi:hypothetical protein